MRLLPSFAVATVSSTLAIFVNLATDLKNSWWAWLGVVLLTATSAAISLRPQGKKRDAAARPNLSSNNIAGNVGRNAVQAREITGDIVFGKTHSRPKREKTKTEPPLDKSTGDEC